MAAASAALDQAAKWAVGELVPPGEQYVLLPDLLALTNVRQAGAALGLLRALEPQLQWAALLALVALGAALLVPLLWRAPRHDVLSGTVVGLIAGGVVGNLIDRARLGAAVEFLRVDLGALALPKFDFNLADTAIAAGMALLVLDLIAAEAGADPSPE